jgi:hypothetical protein
MFHVVVCVWRSTYRLNVEQLCSSYLTAVCVAVDIPPDNLSSYVAVILSLLVLGRSIYRLSS